MSDEERFTRRVKADFLRLVDRTDAHSRVRLEQMAKAAVEGRARSRPRVRHMSWPLGAVAAGALAAALVFFNWRDVQPPAAQPGAVRTPADDLSLLLNMDDLDLLERMEFYQWVERQPGILDGAPPGVPASSPRSSSRS
jgi:hypothetical protein